MTKQTNFLFKAINLALNDYADLQPFFNSVYVEDRNIVILFHLAINFIDPKTLMAEKKEIPFETIGKLNQDFNLTDSGFDNNYYKAKFKVENMDLVKKINDTYSLVDDDFILPYSTLALNEKTELIDTIDKQIKQMEQTAIEWKRDLEKRQDELDQIKATNKEVETILRQAKTDNLI